MSIEAAERAIRDGDPDAALRHLQEQVRQRPADAVAFFSFNCCASSANGSGR